MRKWTAAELSRKRGGGCDEHGNEIRPQNARKLRPVSQSDRVLARLLTSCTESAQAAGAADAESATGSVDEGAEGAETATHARY